MRFMERRTNMISWISFIIGLIILLFFFNKLFISSPKQQASEAVSTFYSLEQESDFSSSWLLFHPIMQKKIEIGPYIQDRTELFENFDVDTFTFIVDKPTKVKNWQPSNEDPPFKLAYCMTIVQTYNSKYGNFSIYQQVYTVKEDGHWRILWDYNE